jgi:hypothetical protein
MATTNIHRVLMLIPAARQAAIQSWWTTNVDPNDNGQTWNVGLSADGQAPASFYWASAALTDADLIALVRRLALLAGITVPTAGSLATKQAKLDWLTANMPTITANTGIRLRRADQDGSWGSVEDELAAAGLQRVGGAP